MIVLFLPTQQDIMVENSTYDNILKEIRFLPDRSSFRKIPWNKELGTCFLNFEYGEGKPFEACPRYILRKALE